MRILYRPAPSSEFLVIQRRPEPHFFRSQRLNLLRKIASLLFTMTALSKERLDEVVNAVKETLSDPEIRAISQRAVQAKVWHLQPAVAACLTDLRKEEEEIRSTIMKRMSNLVYQFHDHTLDATLARAGIMQDDRVHAGSSLDKKETFELFCLDAKERLYMIMKHFGWLKEFFRAYPQHFYENSFQFVDRIPDKKLKVKVKVVGLGIGGSMALSGLAKVGIESAIGYEKRNESGPRSVGSRYQNASWRAYDVARDLLDDIAYQHLIEYRQRMNVTHDDGTTKLVTSDRVQIILGSAIEAAQASAKRYGAKLVFGASGDDYFDNDLNGDDAVDIVALFAGAHTAHIFPGLDQEMEIHSWPDISSVCDMWLRIKPSDKAEFYCAREGEVGAEVWHYTIESARTTIDDVVRVQNSLVSQYDWTLKKMSNASDDEKDDLKTKFDSQMAQLDSVLNYMHENEGRHFDYIFTNAPKNKHNTKKREVAGADGTIVLEGGYIVDVSFASNSTVKSKDLTDKFATDLIVLGGDACVPPNPQAAYGATLACESAQMVVQLAVAYGHFNSIMQDLDEFNQIPDWKEQVQELKDLFAAYYAARSRSENYFQWVQTLICNLYSLPPQ